MDKRTFLKNGAILGLGGAIAGAFPGTVNAAVLNSRLSEEPYKLPDLGFAYDALEPHFDAMTMEVHHSKHHAGYTRKFNAAVKESGLEGAGIKEIFKIDLPRPRTTEMRDTEAFTQYRRHIRAMFRKD